MKFSSKGLDSLRSDVDASCLLGLLHLLGSELILSQGEVTGQDR